MHDKIISTLICFEYSQWKHLLFLNYLIFCFKNKIKGDRSTGYGVTLLNVLFGDSSKNSIIKSLAPKNNLPVKNTPEFSDED